MRSRDGMMPLVVREITPQTPTIVSLRLERPDAAPLPPWEPGAHVDLQLVTRHERQYSLCGDPADAGSYRIGVLREPLSRGGSHYIHRFLRAGSTVYVRPPRNLFALDEAPAYLLLAAGIGVTPILAMARHLAARDVPWRMVYLVRSRQDVAFTADLGALGDAVHVHVSGERGRLDLASTLAGVAAGTHVYACGPTGFIDALGSCPVPEGCRVHVERFEPVRREHRPNEPFTAVCTRSGTSVEVPAERTLLSALQGAGVSVSGSCLSGICGSCAVRVLGGTPEHRDSLTADESATVMYPCVSRALSPILELDV